MRPGVKGMAFNACLHPNRPHLLPKMLLRITDDLLGHVVRQRVVRLIMDRDTRHDDAPLPSGQVAAALCAHSPVAHLSTVARHASSLLTGWREGSHQGTRRGCMHARAYYKGHVGRSHCGRLRTEDGPRG